MNMVTYRSSSPYAYFCSIRGRPCTQIKPQHKARRETDTTTL